MVRHRFLTAWDPWKLLAAALSDGMSCQNRQNVIKKGIHEEKIVKNYEVYMTLEENCDIIYHIIIMLGKNN